MTLWERGRKALRKLAGERRLPGPPAAGIPWLDREDGEEAIRQRLQAGTLTPEQAGWCKSFAEQGYVVFEGLIPEEEVLGAWDAYERFYESHREEFHPSNLDRDSWPERYLNTHFAVPEIAAIMHHPRLLEVTGLLLGCPARPFQSITSHKGTEQGAHSDSIHMTTRPPGYLIAAWVACEEIHRDAGPLQYYPGSHRLPYVLSRDVNITHEDFAARRHEVYHERYEPRIRELIAEQGLEPREFLGGPGDVLVWHANLLHGAGVRRHLERSRKSVVCHYFAEGVECYHDLSGERAVFSGEEGVAVPPVSRRSSSD